MRNVIVVGILATLLLGGCAADGPSPSVGLDEAFSQEVAAQLAYAKTAGASEEQIATLEEVARTGEVTYEQYRESHMAGLACVEDAGFYVSEPYTYIDSGTKVFTAQVAQPSDMSEDAFFAILDACDLEHSLYIDRLYYNQPSATQAWADLIEANREDILACFASMGVDYDEDITWQEMEVIREQIVIDQLEKQGNNPPPIDCFNGIDIMDA